MAKIDTTVGKLVDMIKDGDLRLPEMQRRYVWPATRVRDLLDSLYRGYPSGTILVWETDREMPSRDLDIGQEKGAFGGHRLLLDGQQRLTSLSAVVRAQPVDVRGRKRPIDILFNLDHPDGPPIDVLEVEDEAPEDPNDTDLDATENEEEQDLSLQERLKLRTFVVASRTLSADPRWVRVSDIFNPDKTDAQLLKGLVKSFDDPLFDKYSKRIQAVRKIRDYPYVMHVLDKNLSYEEVAEIFVRVNSLGTKLRSSDLAMAQITSRWRNSLALFEQFQEECEEKWFTLDLGLIVRALVVFTTGQSRFKTAGTIPVARLKEGWERAKEGLRFSINFMRANAGVEDESLLSSPLFLISYRVSGTETPVPDLTGGGPRSAPMVLHRKCEGALQRVQRNHSRRRPGPDRWRRFGTTTARVLAAADWPFRDRTRGRGRKRSAQCSVLNRVPRAQSQRERRIGGHAWRFR